MPCAWTAFSTAVICRPTSRSRPAMSSPYRSACYEPECGRLADGRKPILESDRADGRTEGITASRGNDRGAVCDTDEIGRGHVCNTATNENLVCRLLTESN